MEYDIEESSADPGDDFELTGNTLTFVRDDQLESIRVTIIDDNVPSEPDELIILKLKTPSGGSVQLGTLTTLQLIIVDND